MGPSDGPADTDRTDGAADGLGLIPPSRRVPIPGDVPQTLDVVWDRVLGQEPDREALVSRWARLSYAGLEEEVNAAAAALAALGVGPGDRVAASMGNHAELAVAFFAVMRLGGVWVGINRALAGPEKAFALADVGARVLLADRATCDQVGSVRDELADLVHLVDAEPGTGPEGEWRALVDDARGAGRPGRRIDAHSPAAISFTSGTTGRPKGAVHSQHNILVVAAQSAARGAADASHQPRTGVCLPLTLLNLMILGPVMTAFTGGTAVLIDRTDPLGLAEWVRGERITALSVVPTILYDLLAHPDVDFDALTRGLATRVGGADCPPAWRRMFAERGLVVTPTYGLTEAPTGVTMGDPDQPDGSCGRALPHLRLVVVDEDDRELPAGREGEVCVGPATTGPWADVYTPMLGYWRRPGESARALRGGMLHTGDVGHLDSSGYLFLHDRRNDLILRGGANVYPAEVERVLAGDPRVVASAVVGVPDERLGERVVAVVELRAGQTAQDQELLEELLELCRRELARYKVPSEIRVVRSLPRTEMGKVVRRDVRLLFTGPSPADTLTAGGTDPRRPG